jgi:hypothetical protein
MKTLSPRLLAGLIALVPALLHASTEVADMPEPSHTPSSLPSTSDPATFSELVPRDLPEIHSRIALPKEWTLVPGKLMEGDVLLAAREKIASESDPWIIGLSMTIDRAGAKESGQKASAYALALAREARERAGDEASPIVESQSGPFRDVRFEFPVAGDEPLLITELLRANDETGTLVVILWQTPKVDSQKYQGLREAILSGIQLDPAL